MKAIGSLNAIWVLWSHAIDELEDCYSGSKCAALAAVLLRLWVGGFYKDIEDIFGKLFTIYYWTSLWVTVIVFNWDIDADFSILDGRPELIIRSEKWEFGY